METPYINLSLRLNLSDFIDTTYESVVMDNIVKSYSDLSTQFKLYLWYDSDDVIPHSSLKDFMLKYEKVLHYKTKIRPNNELDRSDYVWYNVESDACNYSNIFFRFNYKYPEPYGAYGILNGIEEFNKCASFCLSPKEQVRKQKRNDGV
jgi:hypothetical protein